MKKTMLAGVLVWMAITACKKEEACTTEFKTISVTITNFDGSPASFEKLNLIRLSTNDTIAVSNDGGASHPLIDDNFKISESEDFLLRGFKQGALVISESYTFGYDGCHVSKILGKGQIQLD